MQGLEPKILRLPLHPLLLPFSRRTSWLVSHFFYFPILSVGSLLSLAYGRPLVIALRPRTGTGPYLCSQELRIRDIHRQNGSKQEGNSGRQFVEISGYSFVSWAIISVDDPAIISHEFRHVQAWLGPFTSNKLAFNVVPPIVLGILIAPLVGWGTLSLAFSLALMFVFSLTAFVKTFH